MKHVFLFLCALWINGEINAIGFEIKIRLDAARNEKVLLAHYFGPNIFVDDTVKTDAQGVAVFKRDTLLPQGIYKIYVNQEKHFDFLLGADQSFSISNKSFAVEGQEIKGALESEEFLQYMKWLRLKQDVRKDLDSARVKAPEAEKVEIDNKIDQLSKEVSAYWQEKSAKYPGSFLGAFLMSNYYNELKESDIPAEFLVNDSLKWLYQYTYRKNHFFDNFDLSDERLLYTPIIKQKLDAYFERILLQMYDSVKPAAYQMLKKVESKPKMFRYVVSYLLNGSLSSKVMGMDALFVDIARDYYISGKAHWTDSTTLAKIRENVIFMNDNLIGKPARDFQMEAYDGSHYRLYQQRPKYTILAFYEPNCSHCREYIPQLYNEIFLPYRDKGLEVVAVYTMADKKEWGDFLENHHLTDWVNIWDPNHVTRFKITYDTRTTPAVYLLDRDKKIIAKKFTLEFLKMYIPQQLGTP